MGQHKAHPPPHPVSPRPRPLPGQWRDTPRGCLPFPVPVPFSSRLPPPRSPFSRAGFSGDSARAATRIFPRQNLSVLRTFSLCPFLPRAVGEIARGGPHRQGILLIHIIVASGNKESAHELGDSLRGRRHARPATPR